MPYLKSIRPIIPVQNIEKSIEFFKTVLGFSISIQQESYARMQRDNVGISLVLAGDNIGQLSSYILVEDIEALHEELKPALEKLPKGRYRPLFTQGYGMKEFHVIDLDSLLLLFGESVEVDET